MDYSSKSKKVLKALADFLEIDVEAKKKNKPTTDELVTALEAYEDQDAVAEAYKELGFTDEDETGDDEDQDDAEDGEEDTGKGTVFTYVGKGESSPRRINFMSKQEFVIGRSVKVTDKELIRKLKGNPTFVVGKADPDLIQQIEDEGAELADENRKIDKKMNAQFKKQHGGSGKGE